MLYQWLYWGRLGFLLVKGPLTNPHVPHRSQICPTQVPHRYHMDPIWVPHRHPAATQIPCRSHTGPTHTRVPQRSHRGSIVPHGSHTLPRWTHRAPPRPLTAIPAPHGRSPTWRRPPPPLPPLPGPPHVVLREPKSRRATAARSFFFLLLVLLILLLLTPTDGAMAARQQLGNAAAAVRGPVRERGGGRPTDRQLAVEKEIVKPTVNRW